jgi:hypothetical protein
VVSDKVGTVYFGDYVPTVWRLALCILVVLCEQFGSWHPVFWWLCANSLDVGTVYFGGCVPTVWWNHHIYGITLNQ